MIKQKLLLAAALLLQLAICAQERPLVNNMKITKTMKIRAGAYHLTGSASLEQGVITITGENITIDFNNAILDGGKPGTGPDAFKGVAVVIMNSRNVTIKNLRIKGYKIALLARNTEKLVLERCDLSYNYRQRLNSSQEKEDMSDWMSYHHNEKDEWLRYGAAIYLRNCSFATIRDCRVTGGQNALMMMECNDDSIYNNDFSFNSGIGLGMYHCSRNKVMYNKIDFNVRGYSDGVYNRGQDSAGILVYEQSDDNFFYKNSVTHGGDGFFLWAGQTTMDSGQGGCNDNVIMDNNFSDAPANGIEATFSRNIIVNNRLFGCDYGLWGGYSYQTNISGNKFRDNQVDIAIEQGQQNKITYNVFYEGRQAIKLWGRDQQPADWGYAKYRDVSSRDYVIAFNNFSHCENILAVNHTSRLNFFGNIIDKYVQLFKTDSTVAGLDTTVNEALSRELSNDTTIAVPEIANPADPFKGNGKWAGRKNIMMTDWGPYDFRSPIIWNTNPADTGSIMQFNIIGPAGKWDIKKIKGVENLSSMSGTFPASLTATKIKGEKTDILVELEYKGSIITTGSGQNIPAGKPSSFYFKKFIQPIDWEVNWFDLDSSYDPTRSGRLFPAERTLPPFKTEKTRLLDYAWWDGIKTDKMHERFVTIADGYANFLPGAYEMSVTWDDAVRVFIDDRLVFNEWDPSKYSFDDTPSGRVILKLAGNQHIRVEHVNLKGFSALALKIRSLQ